MKLKEFLCNLACWSRNALCWVWRHVVSIWKFYMSADTWKDDWEFIKSIKKDFKIAFKRWGEKVFMGRNPSSIPIKRGILALPGKNSYAGLIDRIIAGCIILCIFIGILIGTLLAILALINSVFGVVLLIILFCLLLPLPILFYQIQTYRLGYLGERSVAEELEKYGRNRYWQIFHSLFISEPKDEDDSALQPKDDIDPPTPKKNNMPQANKETKEEKKGDIDHVVVCPNGIFCVETKAWRWFKDKKIYIIDKDEETKIRIEDENGKIYYDKILDNWHPRKQPGENAKRCDSGDEFVSAVRRTRQNAIILHKFLKDKGVLKVPFVVPIVFPVNTQVFHETDESTIENYVTSKLIIGNSENVNEIFDKYGQDPDKSTLSPKRIEEIGQTLEEESRTDIKEEKEILEE